MIIADGCHLGGQKHLNRSQRLSLSEVLSAFMVVEMPEVVAEVLPVSTTCRTARCPEGPSSSYASAVSKLKHKFSGALQSIS